MKKKDTGKIVVISNFPNFLQKKKKIKSLLNVHTNLCLGWNYFLFYSIPFLVQSDKQNTWNTFWTVPQKKHNATLHIEGIQLISCLNFRNSLVKLETV